MNNSPTRARLHIPLHTDQGEEALCQKGGGVLVVMMEHMEVCTRMCICVYRNVYV